MRKVGGGEVAASGVYLRRLQKTADESRRVWLWSPKPSPGGRTVSGMPMIPPIGADVAKCASVKGAQNWNGATETDILPSEDCWTVKLTSFEAFVSPTITEIEPRSPTCLGVVEPHRATDSKKRCSKWLARWPL